MVMQYNTTMKTRLESCTWMFTSTGPRPIQINMGPDPNTPHVGPSLP